ncbi:MAG TPA: alpha/beta hydrolase family protein [Streptosporangiaceae bacterium]|nr:alpha/beta hydrolase family protein [Streptosporangiaceae bacterium]
MRAWLVLVHSPLVGCGIWEPIARLLAADGYAVAVPDLAGAVRAGPPYHRRLARVIAASAADRDVVLVGYSRAGPLLATAGTMLGARARGYVFVDARLPAPGRSWLQTVAPDQVVRLKEMADPQGLLPPWPQWQAGEALAALVPDPALRQQFVAGCPRLPLAMLAEVQPPAPGWPDAACGYLQLSAAYQDEAARARELGWPVRQQPGHHLALLTQPGQVARQIRELTGQP